MQQNKVVFSFITYPSELLIDFSLVTTDDDLERVLLQLGISKSVTELKMNDLKVLFLLLGGEDTI